MPPRQRKPCTSTGVSSARPAWPQQLIRKLVPPRRNGRPASSVDPQNPTEDRAVASFAPPNVPYGADETIFVVIENADAPGGVEREAERSDLETVVADLLAGQFEDPVRVLAFNTLEHWSKDLSADVAGEIQARCDSVGVPVPDHLKDFVEGTGAALEDAAGLV